MPAQPALRINAHAKVNLALSVGPPQPPKGYHPICSWMVPIDLHDTLTIEPLTGPALSSFSITWANDAPRPTPIDWPIENDLTFRAHALLERCAAHPLPVRATLEKRTPVGGGLGGGSSDAAAMLRGVRHLFGLTLSTAELRALSSELGSDVAFFLDGDDHRPPRPAIVSGFGDRLERVPCVPADLVLFIPPFGCPTGPVYQAFDRWPELRLEESRVRDLVREAAATGRVEPRSLFNALAAPACAVEPRLATTLSHIRGALGDKASVHVTGSGSTMFMVLDDGPAVRVASRVRDAVPGVVSLAARLI